MFEGIGPVHLLIVLVVALIVIGPSKLPEVGAALGKGIKEFRGAMADRPETPAITAGPAQVTQNDPTPGPASEQPGN
jgi:sec-independent protein translocase protein TatA